MHLNVINGIPLVVLEGNVKRGGLRNRITGSSVKTISLSFETLMNSN